MHPTSKTLCNRLTIQFSPRGKRTALRTTPQLRTDAIVVRRVAYGEADLIVTLYTRELGKISALARSARRSRKRFGGGLELFNITSLELKKTRANQE